MKLLEERILKDGDVLGENILKVDSFLTHQVDFELMQEIGKVLLINIKKPALRRLLQLKHLELRQQCTQLKHWAYQ